MKKRIRGVKFIGNPQDHTGYGRACLSTIQSMLAADINVSVQLQNFLHDKQPLSREVMAAVNRPVSYDSVVIELTPEHIHQHLEKGKKNIGYFFWETDRIPKKWVECCSAMQEIWAPCNLVKDACVRAGVKTPIHIVPQATCAPRQTGKKIAIPGTNADTYIFYAVFQWTERKNPACMIKAYYDAFRKSDNVVLVIKSYRANDSLSEQTAIKQEILAIKQDFGADVPPIYFVGDILSASIVALSVLSSTPITI